MLKHRLKLPGKILLALIVLLLVILLFERFRGPVSSARYERELIRKGEKLKINKHVAPPIPDLENRAADFLELSGLTEKNCQQCKNTFLFCPGGMLFWSD